MSTSIWAEVYRPFSRRVAIWSFGTSIWERDRDIESFTLLFWFVVWGICGKSIVFGAKLINFYWNPNSIKHRTRSLSKTALSRSWKSLFTILFIFWILIKLATRKNTCYLNLWLNSLQFVNIFFITSFKIREKLIRTPCKFLYSKYILMYYIYKIKIIILYFLNFIFYSLVFF